VDTSQFNLNQLFNTLPNTLPGSADLGSIQVSTIQIR
jgi:hypothetical protein